MKASVPAISTMTMAVVFSLAQAALADSSGLTLAADTAPSRANSPRKTLAETRLIVQLDLDSITSENRAEILSRLRMTGADGLEITCAEIFSGGESRQRTMARLASSIRYFEDAGYAVGVWMSTLGYGGVRGGDFAARYPGARQLRGFNNRESAYCATCPQTLAAAQENVREIIKAGANFILLDDDLVQCCRPSVGCVCDEHVRRYAMKLGRPVSAAEIRASLTGPANAVRTAFYDVMGDSLLEFCRGLRAAADAHDPSVNIGICASITHYDMDGVDMTDVLKVLTAKGARPFLRASGATYWPTRSQNSRNFGQGLGGIAEFVRYQAAQFRNMDMLFCDENDTYPRSTREVPAGMCEVYDKVMVAEGIVRNKYLLRHDLNAYAADVSWDSKTVPVDPAYLTAHVANIPADREIAALFRDTRAFGFRIYRPLHIVREAEMPKMPLSDNDMIKFYSQPLAGIYLSANGTPTQYEREDLPGAAFGWEAVKVPASAYSRGLVLDREGAEALTARGVDVGLGNRAAKRFGDWSLYANADGGRFAVCDRMRYELDWNATANRTFPSDPIWRFFTDRPLPVRLESRPGVYMLTRERADGSFAVLLCNMRGEGSGPLRVISGERCRELTLAGWGFAYFAL